MPIEIIHHGAKETVTGSCHELSVGESGILIDCGLLQGDDAQGEETPATFPFPVDRIAGVIITHVHIDHVGRLPALVAAGYTGPIWCSEASAKLLPVVIEDAMKVGVTRNRRLIEAMVERVTAQTRGLPWNRWTQIPAGNNGARVRIRLQRAGHILGSAYVEIGVRERAGGREQRVVMSGDLGAPWAPLLPSPASPYGADLLVLESTYGDSLHPDRRRRRAELQAVLERALRDDGVVLIPAFSLGRTQELLYEMESIIHDAGRKRASGSGVPWNRLEIIVDSPLAARFTGIFQELAPLWDAEARRRVRAGRHPLSFEQLYTIDDHESHLKAIEFYAKSGRPAVVLAASGMCTGGRIVNWLKAMISRPRTDVVFVGYQGAGTPGRAIQTYAPAPGRVGGYVTLDGERYDIRAGVHTLRGYSAHADQNNLLRFVRGMRKKPSEIRLVHGEREAQEALARKLREMVPGVRVG